jgi:hypothetical protein
MWENLQIENLIVRTYSYADTAPVSEDKIKAAAECWNRVGEMSAGFGVTTGHHEFFLRHPHRGGHPPLLRVDRPRYVSSF